MFGCLIDFMVLSCLAGFCCLGCSLGLGVGCGCGGGFVVVCGLWC